VTIMNIHMHYLYYVLRHKWYVFLECCKLGIPFLGIAHDCSKFRLSEWLPYARYFYGEYPVFQEIKFIIIYMGLTKEDVSRQFDFAWLLHQKRNKHHWQWWLLLEDDGGTKVLAMPDMYRREMLADWRGAGKAMTGKDNTAQWYIEHHDKMQLHPDTRNWIEKELGYASE